MNDRALRLSNVVPPVKLATARRLSLDGSTILEQLEREGLHDSRVLAMGHWPFNSDHWVTQTAAEGLPHVAVRYPEVIPELARRKQVVDSTGVPVYYFFAHERKACRRPRRGRHPASHPIPDSPRPGHHQQGRVYGPDCPDPHRCGLRYLTLVSGLVGAVTAVPASTALPVAGTGGFVTTTTGVFLVASAIAVDPLYGCLTRDGMVISLYRWAAR